MDSKQIKSRLNDNEYRCLSDRKFAKVLADELGLEYKEYYRVKVGRVRKKYGVKKLSQDTDSKTSWHEEKGQAQWNYNGTKSIQTLEQAIEHSNVDLNIWEVEKHVFNSWDVTSKIGRATNYQVKVWFKRKDVDDKEIIEFQKKVNSYLGKRKTLSVKKRKVKKRVGVIPLADLHIGAYVRELVKTQDFDVEKVVNMLDEVAEEVNAQNYSEVHISIVGDIIESFTGTNHENSFKSLGYKQYGFNVFIMAVEILENFLSKIVNLHSIYGVSGNHDRHSSSNKLDAEGDVLKGAMYFLKRTFPKVGNYYDPLVISKIIDNIGYVFTHGHHGLAKKGIEKIILDYGFQGYYNVVIQGHLHKRGKKSPVVTNTETIYSDSAKYVGIICPSIFTGNFFSESLGYTSNPGFLMFENKHDRVSIKDIPLAT